MKKLIIIFFFIYIYGANLINVDFFTHKNFVDVLFSLDSKFDGKVIKINNNEYYLQNIKTTKEYIKKFEDKEFLKLLEITPYKDGVLIKIDGENFSTKFDLTPEKYGIRLRIKNNVIKQDSIKELMKQNNENSFDYFTYFIVLAILIILAIILYLIKKRIVKLPASNTSLNIVFQKPIDAKNKIVLIDFNKRKYLMVIGNTNILIDVFDENMININTNKEFDEYLKLNDKMNEIKKYIKNAEELKEFDERI